MKVNVSRDGLEVDQIASPDDLGELARLAAVRGLTIEAGPVPLERGRGRSYRAVLNAQVDSDAVEGITGLLDIVAWVDGRTPEDIVSDARKGLAKDGWHSQDV